MVFEKNIEQISRTSIQILDINNCFTRLKVMI